ncbi:MAG: hypothetical protein SFU98_14045 [Leptospiraceae bacterium]|nr:hypothetical protein [Leptospiraceae bacterium]
MSIYFEKTSISGISRFVLQNREFRIIESSEDFTIQEFVNTILFREEKFLDESKALLTILNWINENSNSIKK